MKNYIISETNLSSSSASCIPNDSYCNSEVEFDRGSGSNYEEAKYCLEKKQNIKEIRVFFFLILLCVVAVLVSRYFQ